MVTVLEVTSLGRYATAWDRLVDAASPPSPFLRSWWLGGVTGGAGVPDAAGGMSRARILLVLDGETLVGGLALAEDRWPFRRGVRRLRMLGGGVLCPDHLDVLAAAHRDDDVHRAIAGWFASTRPAVLDLAGLVDHSGLARVLDATSEPMDAAPFGVVDVPDGSTYLQTRSRNLRRSVGRSARRMETDGYARHGVPREGLAEALGWFEQLHRDREDRAPLLAELPVLSRCLDAGLATEEARIDVLRRGQEPPVAVSIGFTTARRLSMYQVARSIAPEHSDAGTVLLTLVIEDAVASGTVEIDLLRGDEGYKLRLVDDERPVHRIRVAHGTLPRLALRGVRAAGTARRWLSRLSAMRRRHPSPDAPAS